VGYVCVPRRRVFCSLADRELRCLGNTGGDMQEPKQGGKNSLAQLKRVLIVEDDETLRRSLARVVRQWGAQVSEAGSVAEGIELLEENPDLLITDFQMPAMSGLDLARTLKTNPQSASLPIVMLTARGHAITQQDLAMTNIRCLLPKPFRVTLQGL